MPRETTVLVYKFYELSDKAKEQAKTDYKISFGYPWEKETVATLKKLAHHFGANVKRWQFYWEESDSRDCFVTFDCGQIEFTKEELDKLIMEELGSYNPITLMGDGDCKLTGWAEDESAIDGIRYAYLRDGVTDTDALLQAGFKTLAKSAQENYANFYSNKQFNEHSDANGYEYTIEGKLV